MPRITTLLALAAGLGLAGAAPAATDKLRLTGGVSSIDGAAGGGLSPWALVGTHATAGQWGLAAHLATARTQDYRLNASGLMLALDERFEFSLAHQSFDTGRTGAALGVPGLQLRQDILGAKWRLAGEAVLDSDTWMPQLAMGVLARRLDAGGLAPTLDALGARRRGTELYLSASKLFLAQGLLVNATLRASQANQGGLLGHGGRENPRRRLLPELSVAWLLHPTLAVGVEYRAKPNHLNPSLLGAGLKEDDWRDLFVAWAPAKQVSVTAAWLDLGRIVPAVTPRRQTGGYLSIQFTH